MTTEKRPPRIYIAGPYTRGGQATHVRNALLTADCLFNRGAVPFVPHLSHFWDMLTPHPYDAWTEYDLEWLRACDALFRLPGESAGADREEAEAVRLGLPVLRSLREADAFLKAWDERKEN